MNFSVGSTLLQSRLLRAAFLSAVVAFCCFGSARAAEASHFRYGHLTWRATGPTTAAFTLITAYRRSEFNGTAGDGFVAIGDLFSDGVDIEFGDGTSSGGVQFQAIAIDPTADFVVGRSVNPMGQPFITHTYPSANNKGLPWEADYASCCRISTLQNNSDSTFRILSRVDLSGNAASPVSALPAIIGIPAEGGTFSVPANDPGQNLRFRLATEDEASTSDDFVQIPGATVDPATGLYTVPNGLAAGLWNTQVIIEELDGAKSVVGQVAVDFLINVGGATGAPPVFIAPTPASGTTFTVSAGQTLTFTVSGEDPDSDSATLNSTGAPAGATQTPALPTSGEPASSVFSWTPTPADAGNYSITYTLSDANGGFALTSINIIVSEVPLVQSVRLTLFKGKRAVARTLLRRDNDGTFRGVYPRLAP